MSALIGGMMSRAFKKVGSKFAGLLGKKVAGRLGNMGLKQAGNRLGAWGQKKAFEVGQQNFKQMALDQAKQMAKDKAKQLMAQQGEAFVGRLKERVKNTIEKGGTNIGEIAEVAQATARAVAPAIAPAVHHSRYSGGGNVASQSRHQMLREQASRKSRLAVP